MGINNNDRCVFTGENLIRGIESPVIQSDLSLSNFNRFEFASKATAHIAAELNVAAFQRGQWSASLSEKYFRNLSHIVKNPLCIMLLKSEDLNRYIGFTHIIPVTKFVWDSYLHRQVSDNDFSDNNVTSLDASDVYGLIFFSVACIGIQSDFKKESNYQRSLGNFLELASIYHAHEIINVMFKEVETIPVLLQNSSIHCLKYFDKYCINSDHISKDQERIITFTILNKNDVPDKNVIRIL